VNDWRPLHHRLLNRIHRRYRTVTQAILVGGREYSFTRIADPNRVLDEIAEEEDRIEKVSGRRKNGNHLHLPYWAELWDSALAMGELLVKRFHDDARADIESPFNQGARPKRLRVLDLGCGMGFTGMVAASLGLHVTFADLEPPALLFARLNSLPYRPAARTRQLNWQTTRLPGRFDLILGADILYERAQWDHLEPFWRHHLAPAGSVLLGEPGRKTSDDFPAWVPKRGWDLGVHEQCAAPQRRIRLFELRRSAETAGD
jgi:2-polyprenyl-3-methyl-5-hydroxy-6-metoxy-1,4-benzoquinol methylase